MRLLVRTPTAQHPQSGERAGGDAVPNPQAALPHANGPTNAADFVLARRQEVQATADHPGRESHSATS